MLMLPMSALLRDAGCYAADAMLLTAAAITLRYAS